MIRALLLIGWAFGWGWWSHDEGWVEVVIAAAWPFLLPIGRLYHLWRWGPKQHRRFVYTDTRWWQRGDKVRRPR